VCTLDTVGMFSTKHGNSVRSLSVLRVSLFTTAYIYHGMRNAHTQPQKIGLTQCRMPSLGVLAIPALIEAETHGDPEFEAVAVVVRQVSSREEESAEHPQTAHECAGMRQGPRLQRTGTVNTKTSTIKPTAARCLWKCKKGLRFSRLSIFMLAYMGLGMVIFMNLFRQSVPTIGRWWHNVTWNASSEEPPPLPPVEHPRWSAVQALYFSVVTITTVGYGDLGPFSGGTDPSGEALLLLIVYVSAAWL
jgi:hypothetical protein